MSRVFFAILAGLLVCISGSSTASPNVTETDVTEAVGCDVIIRGVHGGASDEIIFDAGESQVRARVGWWASLARGGDVAQHTLSPSGSFSEEFDLRLGCNAHRRYRFVFRAGSETFTYVFPSDDGYTQDLTIDLGDVSRFFDWIEPGIFPLDETQVVVDAASLQGEWVRRDSNHDPNDGMRIDVSGDQAVLTFVPETASASHWRVGEVLWKNIGDNGELEVLGSNDSYYDAEIGIENSNRLHIDIAHNGAGNDQTWVRTAGCWPDDYMAGYPDKAPDMWVRFSTDLPSGFQAALRAARDAHAPIQTSALTPDDEWVVVAANKPCYSAGFPSDARDWIDDYIASGREIDVVAFGPGGRWLIVAEDYLRRTSNVSDEIMQAIRRAQENNLRVTSFAFSPYPDERWALTAGGEAVTGRARVALPNNILAAGEGLRPVHEIAIDADDNWAMVAEDWFTTKGIPTSLLEWMETYRTDSRRRIDHVVLHEVDGQTRWAIISNEQEPTPATSDLVNRFEHEFPGDSTIFQRMKLHRVTGLSIALVANNEVAWARSYGRRRVDFPEEYVLPNTIFDAASISKPVSYAGALQLVDDGEFGLTETGVLYDLSGNDMPTRNDLDGIRADEIHLAHLFSHCAGIDNEKGNSGAQSMNPGSHMPTYREIFRGDDPAASGNQIVRVDSVEVGEMSDYSGANSVLIQMLMEQHASGGYDGQMQRLLDDLDMSRSTFSRDFHEMIPSGSMASGHVIADGQIWSTNIKAYPNQAAAGLRTTASDLAHFVIMLNQGGLFNGRRLLNATTVDRFLGRDGAGGVADMACQDRGSMQLGIRAKEQGTPDEEYWHGGLHNGFRTMMDGRPDQNAGLVIFVTGATDDASALRVEVRDAINSAYGWHF